MKRVRCESCPIRADTVIGDLPIEDVPTFSSIGVTSLCRPNQILFCEGNPCLGLYVICSGTAKLYYSDRLARDYVLDVVGPGTVLGELDPTNESTLSVSAVAITDLQLCFLPSERLVSFLVEHPKTAIRLVTALSRELSRARRKVRELAFKSAEGRIAGFLLKLATVEGGEPPEEIELRYTRRDVAEMIGVSTETAIRLLARLRVKGVIDVQQRRIAILDAARLRRIAEQDEITV